MEKRGRPRKEGTKVLYIRLPISLAVRVAADAKAEKRELSNMVSVIVGRHYGS